jgi:hypothetical protein
MVTSTTQHGDRKAVELTICNNQTYPLLIQFLFGFAATASLIAKKKMSVARHW